MDNGYVPNTAASGTVNTLLTAYLQPTTSAACRPGRLEDQLPLGAVTTEYTIISYGADRDQQFAATTSRRLSSTATFATRTASSRSGLRVLRSRVFQKMIPIGVRGSGTASPRFIFGAL